MNKKYAPFIKAILYADIFDFPLFGEEVFRYAIGKSTKKNFEQFLTKPPSFIKQIDGLYSLRNRNDLTQKRLKRQKASERKLIIARKACSLLATMPTIQFIGISGGLALFNADAGDDIDFFIITKKNTIWTSRFLVTLLLELYGLRRRRGGSDVSDSICVNMYLDEKKMQLSQARRDLYSAHEVVQVFPLFSRNNTYEKFMHQNKWVDAFLPNASDYGVRRDYKRTNDEKWLGSVLINPVFEYIVKVLQEWYMRRHRTREVVSDTILAFHPVDYRGNTLSEFSKRVKKYEKV